MDFLSDCLYGGPVGVTDVQSQGCKAGEVQIDAVHREATRTALHPSVYARNTGDTGGLSGRKRAGMAAEGPRARTARQNQARLARQHGSEKLRRSGLDQGLDGALLDVSQVLYSAG